MQKHTDALLQAMVEATSLHQAGATDRAPSLPFPANASSHLPDAAMRTGMELFVLRKMKHWCERLIS